MRTTALMTDVSARSGSNVPGLSFGAFQTFSINGRVFHDANGDRVQQADEPGLSGWTVYLDANSNGTLDSTFGTGGKVTTDFAGGQDGEAFPGQNLGQ